MSYWNIFNDLVEWLLKRWKTQKQAEAIAYKNMNKWWYTVEWSRTLTKKWIERWLVSKEERMLERASKRTGKKPHQLKWNGKNFIIKNIYKNG